MRRRDQTTSSDLMIAREILDLHKRRGYAETPALRRVIRFIDRELDRRSMRAGHGRTRPVPMVRGE